MIHYLVPDFILSKHLQGESSGQLFGATLFLDISGFSSMTDALMQHGKHGAEVMATIVRSVFEPAVRAVHQQGGFISGFAGDAFTAIFAETGEGEPQAQPTDSAHRALAAAWAIQQTMAVAGRFASPYGDFSLSAKIGLAYGEIIWGIVRSGDRSRAMHYFRGAAIDGCAQAEHLAQPGDIIITSELHPRLEHVAELQGVESYQRVVTITGLLPPAQPASQPTGDVDTIARFFPRNIVTQQYSGEFRHVVNVFISLPTVRSEAQLAALMQSVFSLQERYGGLLNRLDFGDKGSNMLLFWGAPITHENDIERALDFVRTLQANTSIPVHAGIAYRISHAGFIGSAWREEYTCYGRGVNLAARLMAAAPRDEIWLDEAVAQRAARNYEIEPAGEYSFKGFAQKQQVHLLIDRKEADEPTFSGELIGRRAELARLEAFAQPLWSGRFAGAAVILGEAGLGKSRLVYAFRTSQEVEARSVLWARCQVDQTLRDPLNPFRYWLMRYFGQSHGQAEARNKRSFNRKLDDLVAETRDETLAMELDRTRSCLGALIGLHWPDSLYEEMDAETRHENTLDGLKALIKAESRRQPIILHIEDAHWLDSDSAVFLERLTQDADDFPMALVITMRPDTAPSPFGERQKRLELALAYESIDLEQMSLDDLALLASHLLNAPVAPSLVAQLDARAEGNPFFAEQIVLYLKEQGLVQLDATGTASVPLLPDQLLTTDVQALLVARIDRLTAEVKEAVQTAAVIGREFEGQMLSFMLRTDTDWFSWVRQAEETSIWSQLNELSYVFKHVLLQGAAYEMLLRSRRQELHRLAAEAIETLFAADLAPHYTALAYHHEQAGAAEPAARYLEKAGHAAADSYHNNQAIDCFGRALALLQDPARLLALLFAREAVHDRLGNREAQAEDLGKAHALAMELGDLGQIATVALRSASLASFLGDYPKALAHADQAASQAQQIGDASLEARALSQRGAILIRAGDYDGAQLRLETALGLATTAGDAKTSAECLTRLGHCALAHQDYTAATHHYASALETNQTLHDRRGEINCRVMFGVIYRRQGMHEMASASYQQALTMAQDIGWKYGQADLLGHMGNHSLDLGDLQAAARLHRQALKMCQKIGDREGEALSIDSLGLIAYAEGKQDEARRRYDEALAIQRAIGYRRGEGYALTHLGQVLLDLGEPAEAEEAFLAALAIRQALSADNPAAVDDMAGLAQAALARGDTASALAHAEKVLDWLENHGTTGVESPTLAFLSVYQVLSSADQPQAAARVLQLGYDDLQQRAAAIQTPAMREQFLDGDPHNRLLISAWRELQERL